MAPPAAVIALDVWSGSEIAHKAVAIALGGGLPPLNRSAWLSGGWRATRIEPSVWWLIGPLEDLQPQLARLVAALDQHGGATDLSGGVATLVVTGEQWRELLMIGGVFDAEAGDFGAGRTAGTLLDHVGVRYDVIDDDEVHIHLAPSYADHLAERLGAAAARLDAAER
jgi:heterotetrameric sarcosine oxidase gamma subunit